MQKEFQIMYVDILFLGKWSVNGHSFSVGCTENSMERETL